MSQSSDSFEENEYALATLAIRTGHDRTHEGEHSEPIFLTSSFVCESAADAEAKFSGKIEGNTYSRYTNPTVHTFEKRLAKLDGAERAIATSSGMAAVHAMCMAYLKAGDHVICSRAVFGSIISLFEKYVMKFAVEVTFVDLDDLDAWKNAIRPTTRLLFIETPSNPLAQVGDMQAIADIAHAHGALFAVDNCFCTPMLQQPIKFGADLVLYSATKYIDGQGRALGGAVVGKHDLLEEVNVQRQALEAELQAGRDRLLEYNSCRPVVAQGIVQALEDYDDNTTLPMFVKRFMSSTNIDFDEQRISG